MKRFLFRFLLFLFFAIVASSILSLGLDKLFAAGFRNSKAWWILDKENGHYDFASIGSSRVYNMIDIPVMEEILKQKGINLGTSGSSYAENYLILEQFLRKNSIKTLFVGIDEFCFSSAKSYSYPFHDFEFIPLFHDDTVSLMFKEAIGAKYYLWKFIPISRYIEFNERFTFLHSIKSNTEFYTHLDSTKGYSSLADSERVNKIDTLSLGKKRIVKPDPLDVKYFLKIVSLCRTYNIEVILITPPVSPAMPPSEIDGQDVIMYCMNLAKQLDLTYYHFNQVGDFSKTDYFRDYSHTNKMGTSYYSSSLAKQLGMNTDLKEDLK
jgi:hypothetical protein